MSFVKAPVCFLWCVHITSLFYEDIVIPLIYYLTINIAINHREKIIVCFWSFISAINHHFPGKDKRGISRSHIEIRNILYR